MIFLKIGRIFLVRMIDSCKHIEPIHENDRLGVEDTTETSYDKNIITEMIFLDLSVHLRDSSLIHANISN